MSKSLEPYKAAFSVNADILYSTSNIAYRLGKLSIEDPHIYDKKDALNNTMSLCSLLGIEATPSQFRGAIEGEEIEGKPEILRIYRLYLNLMRFAPYDASSIEKVEEALFPHGVPGRLSRKIEGFDYPLPMHKKIEPLMNGLFRFANANRKTMNPISLGCMMAFEILAIAPYSRANLAIALLYFHAFLVSYSKSLAALNLVKAYQKHKKAIEDSFALSVEKCDMAPYMLAWMKVLDKGVNGLLARSVKGEGKSNPLVEKLLKAMESGRYYSASELCALLKLKSRLGLQRNYLRPALESKLIVMSNPIVKTDRSQRYCKKGD